MIVTLLIDTSVDNLKQNIILCNKDEQAILKRHRVILIGDSNMKGYGVYLNLLLSNNYNLHSVTKPGSGSNELNQTAKEEISQLSHEDGIIIFSGTNDYELNKFSHTFHNISRFIQTNCHINVILMNVPFRYDLPNSASVNSSIIILNRKLKKLVKLFLILAL